MNMAKDLYDDIESIGRTNKVNHGLENEEKGRFVIHKYTVYLSEPQGCLDYS